MINWKYNVRAVKVFAIEDENILYMPLLKILCFKILGFS